MREKESIEDISGEIRAQMQGLPEDADADWLVCDMLRLADRIEAAYKSEWYCPVKYDKDGNEMPLHCAFADIKLDSAKAHIDRLKDFIRTGLAIIAQLVDDKDDASDVAMNTKRLEDWIKEARKECRR